MATKNQLARLMKLSWDIQRSKHYPRAKSLHVAWMILLNEDISTFYLMRRLNHGRHVSDKAVSQYVLF